MQYIGKPKIIYVGLHHTAVSRSKQTLQRDAVNNHHRNKWNFPSRLNGSYVGYNFFCEPTGKRTQERYIGEETIAQIGSNCDIPSRCTVISYCMAGDFRVENPTTQQVEDFKDFVTEVRKKYPKVKIRQHKDLAPNRTCAELTTEYIDSWFKKPPNKDAIIKELKRQNKQLIALVTLLIKMNQR